MKLVVLIGNSSVGKMTVGQELMKITDLKLFHNHMSIEPVLEIFGSWNQNAIKRIRSVIFEEFSSSNQYGLIFTYMMAFNLKEDWDYLNELTTIFQQKNAEIFYIELIASLEERLRRNETENRLKNKPSKRNIELSKQRLIQDDASYRLESIDGEIPFPNYLKINTTNLTAEAVASQIKKHFNL